MREDFIYSLLYLHILIIAILHHIFIVAYNFFFVVFSEIKSRREYIGSVFIIETLLISFGPLCKVEFLVQ
jgi:hypothetical protein